MRTDPEFATRNSQPATSLATANEIRLAPYALDDSALQRVFGQILTHQVDYADLYFQYSRSEGWSLEEGIVKSGSFNIDQGVGVRAISGEKTAFAYSDEISLPALRDAAQTTRAIAQSGAQTAVRVRGKPARRAAAHDLYRAEDPLASLPDAAKVKLLERLEQMCRAMDTRVVQVMASLAA